MRFEIYLRCTLVVLLVLKSCASALTIPLARKGPHPRTLLEASSRIRNLTSHDCSPPLVSFHSTLGPLQSEGRKPSVEDAPFHATRYPAAHWTSQTKQPTNGVQGQHPRQLPRIRVSNRVVTARQSLSDSGNGNWSDSGYRSSRRRAVRLRLEEARQHWLGWMANADAVTAWVPSTTVEAPTVGRAESSTVGRAATMTAAAAAAPSVVLAGHKRRRPSNKRTSSSSGARNVFRYNPNWPWVNAGRGPCSHSNITLRVSTLNGILRRRSYPPRVTVVLMLMNSLTISQALTLDHSFSCTILTAGAKNVRITATNANQPVMVVWKASNVLVHRISFHLPVTVSSAPCTSVPDSQHTGKVVCPAVQVWKSYGVQIAKGSVFGRVEVARSMHVSIDSMRLTNIFPFEAANGVVRVLVSGYGPTVLRSGISISNNEIFGSDHGIVLHFGAVGVDVHNNYIHHCQFTGIRCGDIINAVGDCMATNSFHNYIYNPPSYNNAAGDSDNSGIYYQTHWVNPGNLDTCNYVEGTDHCYFLDNASSGVRIIGGVCIRTGRGIKTNTGKNNVVKYVIQKGVPGESARIQCLNLQTSSCLQWGKVWNIMYKRYYNTKKVNQLSPFLSTVCSATTANGAPCNPAGGYAVVDSGGCSGLPTDNYFDLVLVSPGVNNTPPGYILCDPSVGPLNNVRHMSKPSSFFHFLDPQRNNLGLEPSSPVYRLRPNFRSCDRSLVGPKPRKWRTYMGRFNIPKPDGYNRVVTFDYNIIQDSSVTF